MSFIMLKRSDWSLLGSFVMVFISKITATSEIMLYHSSLISKLRAQGRSILKDLYVIIVYMLK